MLCYQTIMVRIIVLNFTFGVLNHPRVSAFSPQRPGQAEKGEFTPSLHNSVAWKDLSGPPKILAQLLPLVPLFQGNSESQERQASAPHTP